MSHDKPGEQCAPLDPVLFEGPAMRVALAVHDFATVYQTLTECGISQRRIAGCTGQSQSEVSEIRQGRRVVGTYALLVRICDGLVHPARVRGCLVRPQRCLRWRWHGRRPPGRR